MNLKAEQLATHLKNGLAPVYLVSGDEPVLLQESCDAIRKAAKEQGFSERISLQVDKSFAWQDFMLAANSSSLFSSKSLLDISMPTAKPGKSGGQILQDYLAQPAADKLLLIVTNKVDAATQKTKWFKAVSNAGVVVQVWPIPLNQLPGWLANRMRRVDLKTTPEALKLLAEYAEGNLLAAVQEIEKLHLLYGSGELSLEQVMAAVVDNARFNVFDLLDVTLLGDVAKSVRMLQGLKNEKTEATIINWAFAREIRSLIGMAEKVAQGERLAMVMQQNRVWQKRQACVQRALQQHKLAALTAMLQQCAKIDLVIKGQEPGSVWIELDRLAVALAGGKL